MSIHDDTCNAIEHNERPEDPAGVALRACELPPLLAGLLSGGEFLSGLKPIDLREMSKFDELINIEGLAVHRIERPAPDLLGGTAIDAQSIAGEPELPDGVSRSAARVMCANPLVVTEGTLAGAGPMPFAVRTLIPMTHAHMAAAIGQMLWPWPGDAGPMPVQYTLLFFPGAVARRDGTVLVESFIGHWPGFGVGLVIGFDDPALVARLLLDAAGRTWCNGKSSARLVEPGRMLAAEAKDGDMVCLKRVEDLAGIAPAARPALAEPLFLEEDESGAVVTVSPVWLNPLLPVSALGLDAGWSDTAREVGALPFGGVVDSKGHVALEQVATEPARREERLRNLERGLVVVPRGAIPTPWMRQARQYGVTG